MSSAAYLREVDRGVEVSKFRAKFKIELMKVQTESRLPQYHYGSTADSI